ncbi:hypothetical protein [Bradyrhizobium sp. 930_D9_N1_4]|uniref:hypothetical protein n=1 Tax=Bradyrhizobium sp. 930_D9_N1_4 TaxID=3240374 RepID=UPI003F8AAC63
MHEHLEILHRCARRGSRLCVVVVSVGAALALLTAAAAAEPVQPKQLIVDDSRPRAEVEAQILAARNYDTLWNTGGVRAMVSQIMRKNEIARCAIGSALTLREEEVI